MSGIKLKIRHFKRGGGTDLDISGMDLTEIPEDVFSLFDLESLNISNNKISSLDRIGSLYNLKNLNAKNNRIKNLPKEIRDLNKLENIKFEGNIIAVLNTDLSSIFGTDKVKQAFDKFFGSDSEPAEEISTLSKPSFLKSGSDLNDVSFLRKKIADLQMEITDLKAGSTSTSSTKKAGEGKDWMAASYGERPGTASSQMKKVRDLEDDLQNERKNNKRLYSEVESLKSEISKARILTSAAGEEGTIGAVAGVMEIPYDELDFDDQIGQGGFSVIKKGVWRNTDVAIKIIFDPVITEELIAEIRNEVQMLSILRHPKIVMLMGMCSKPPNLAIVFELMPKG